MSLFTNHLGLILYENQAGHPVLRHGATQWFVNPPLTYMVGAEESGERITVPAFNPVGRSDMEILGLLAAERVFLSDLGSIPQIAWSLGFTPAGPEAKAFVLHDYGYLKKGLGVGYRYSGTGHLEAVDYTREHIDNLLLEAMLVVGADPGKARIIHEAVRIGGAHAWGT